MSKMQTLVLLCLIIFISGIRLSYQISTSEDESYVAAVIEFQRKINGTAKERTQNNLEGYQSLLTSLISRNADIIIFPESTLNNNGTMTYVPDPKDKIAPCDNETGYEDFFRILSCESRRAKTYVVINVMEKSNCNEETQKITNDSRPCALSGLNIYNTNVVFDRNGTVISRYRKWNLYGGGMKKNTTARPEYATFTTDFGVTFGHFICFDILFYTPAQELVKAGVTDFLFTSMWYSQLPFLTAVQQQYAWAYANDVNLLAAGASYPQIGSTGTGIYSGRSGAIVQLMSSQPQRTVLVARVPKSGYKYSNLGQVDFKDSTMNMTGSSILNHIKLKRDKIDHYNSTILDPYSLNITKTLCYGDFCCKATIKTIPYPTTPGQVSYRYKFIAYDGERTYTSVGKSWIKTCAIVACTNDNISSCGTVFDSSKHVKNDFIFREIIIEGIFKHTEKMLVMPNSIDVELQPLRPGDFDFKVKEISPISKEVRYHLNKPNSQILTFGIYANCYEKIATRGIELEVPSKPEDEFYVAAVVEFSPQIIGNGHNRTEDNLSGYRTLITSTMGSNSDIIVFPEGTLNNEETMTFVPDPKDRIAPCDNEANEYETFFQTLSAEARRNKKYIVINIMEKSICNEDTQKAANDPRPCARSGLNIYNTNVVFDRNGTVVSRYRKWNLYGEKNKNTTARPEYETFTTDFGVTFGHFICFDILFYTPTQELVKSGVTHFLYPSMWYSELPFLTAVQQQHAWAYANDVNLLAAGASNPVVGSTGTGIYNGRNGAMTQLMSNTPSRSIRIARLAKQPNGRVKQVQDENTTENINFSHITKRSIPDHIRLQRDEIDNYSSKIIDPKVMNISDNLCYKDFCCNYSIKIYPYPKSPEQLSYQYRFVAYDGERTYNSIRKSLIKTCAIIACRNDSMSSCGTVFDSQDNVNNDFYFDEIIIDGVFPYNEKVLIMPNSVDVDFRPISPTDFDFNVTEISPQSRKVQYYFKSPTLPPRILTFGIYANYFDGVVKGGAAHSVIKIYLLMLSFILTYVLIL